MKYFASKISDNQHMTPEGYLLCLGVSIGRVGDMEYGPGETPLESDTGVVVITRNEQELFAEKTIASFEGKPFTVFHPDDFVNAENWSKLAKGIIQNVRRGKGDQKDDLVADILITDQDTISLVKSGLKSLSCGYEAEYIETGKGTGKQTNIIGNHLALVREGRAGAGYEIRDHKGVRKMSKTLAEKLKSVFSQAVDEAAEGEKKEEAKDAYGQIADMCDKMAKDMMALKDAVSSMSQGSDEEKEEEPSKDEDKEEQKDEEKEESKDMEVSSGLEEKLQSLEAKLDKLLGMGASTDEEKEEEESKDEEFVVTGDEKARLEILAPGYEARDDKYKADALKQVYKTSDGKKIIDTLTFGEPQFDNSKDVDKLFVAVSEVLKANRKDSLANTKKGSTTDNVLTSGAVTPEKLNEINAKFWAERSK